MTFAFSLSVSTDKEVSHTVAVLFRSEAHAEDFEVDNYDECREQVQAWLDRHFPGEHVTTDGDDISNDGSEADFPEDVLDFTAV